MRIRATHSRMGGPRRCHRGFTLIELLTVVAVVAVLITLILPAVQHVRETARRVRCRSNLRQIGVALAGYTEVFGVNPPALINSGRYDHPGFYSHGNRVLNTTGWALLLPWLDEGRLAEQYDYSRCSTPSSPLGMPVAGDGTANTDVVAQHVELLACPSHAAAGEESTHRPYTTDIYSRSRARRSSYTFASGAGTDWDLPWSETVGDIRRGVFGNNGAARPRDIRDGLSSTIAVGESHGGLDQKMSVNFGPWGLTGINTCCHGRVWSESPHDLEPEHVTDTRWGINAAWDDSGRSYAWVFNSSHVDGAQFLLADGSVQFLNEAIDYRTFVQMNYIADGSTVESW